MFWTDPTRDGAAWHNVWEVGKQLVEQFQAAVQDGTLGVPTVSRMLLDTHIGLLQQCLAHLESQLGRAQTGVTEATLYDWKSLLGQWCIPPVNPASLRRFETQTLHAYREMLQGYLALLVEIRGSQETPAPSAPRQGKVPIH